MEHVLLRSDLSVYRYGTRTRSRASSEGATILDLRRPRRRLGDLPSSLCCFQAPARLSLPVPVFFRRLAAPRLVFILGMSGPYIRSPRTAGPQPRDVLRLALYSLASDGGAPAPRRPAARLIFARLGRRGPSPATSCGSHISYGPWGSA